MLNYLLSEPLTALRILCGLWFLPHAMGKMFNVERAAATFDKSGFRPARLFVVVTVALELLAATGLVFGISQFRHSMVDPTIDVYEADGRLTEREVAFEPFDLPAMHVFKIRGGRIYEIEAMGFMTPYLSPSGWNVHLK